MIYCVIGIETVFLPPRVSSIIFRAKRTILYLFGEKVTTPRERWPKYDGSIKTSLSPRTYPLSLVVILHGGGEQWHHHLHLNQVSFGEGGRRGGGGGGARRDQQQWRRYHHATVSTESRHTHGRTSRTKDPGRDRVFIWRLWSRDDS